MQYVFLGADLRLRSIPERPKDPHGLRQPSIWDEEPRRKRDIDGDDGSFLRSEFRTLSLDFLVRFSTDNSRLVSSAHQMHDYGW